MQHIPKALFILTSLTLVGCHTNSGKKYLGHWVDNKNPHHVVDISKDKSGFTYKDRDYNLQDKATILHGHMEHGVLTIGTGAIKMQAILDKNGLNIGKHHFHKGPIDPNLKNIKTDQEKARELDAKRYREAEKAAKKNKIVTPDWAKSLLKKDKEK